MKKIILTSLLLTFTQPILAAGLINDMQACQGIINFLDKRLDSTPDNYNDESIETVRKGLLAYDRYIQQEIVTPGLLQFNGGDKSKADAMQKQVDTYKEAIVEQLEKRYPKNRITGEHAISINNCAKKSVPAGDDLEALKTSLLLMMEIAKTK